MFGVFVVMLFIAGALGGCVSIGSGCRNGIACSTWFPHG